MGEVFLWRDSAFREAKHSVSQSDATFREAKHSVSLRDAAFGSATPLRVTASGAATPLGGGWWFVPPKVES